MNDETEQAEALARWLDGGDPGHLDRDVVEAILALQPERAPAARVDIADLLAHPAVAAMLASGAEAPRLARWLEGEGKARALDRDVAETMHALAPSLAPPPRVRIDDVLQRVTSGPLAAREATVERLRPAAWRRWFGMGGGAVLAAAAVAAVFLTATLPERASPPPFAAAPSEALPLAPPNAAAEPAVDAIPQVSAAAPPPPARAADSPKLEKRSPLAERAAAGAPPAVAVVDEEENAPATAPEFGFGAFSTAGPAASGASGGALGGVGEGGGSSGFGAGATRSPAKPAAAAPAAAPAFDDAVAKSEAVDSARDEVAADAWAEQVVAPSESGMRAAERACRLYLRAGDVAAAIAVAERGLALAPKAPRSLWLAYADALAASGRMADADAARARAGR